MPASPQRPFPAFGGSLGGGQSFFSYGELSGRVTGGLPEDTEQSAIENVDGLLGKVAPAAGAAERAQLATRLAALFKAAVQREFGEAIRRQYGSGNIPPQPNRSST